MSHTFLLNDFYTILSKSNEAQGIRSIINLNEAHPIFKGHFEQMPVVPGVCQTQIIKELLQESFGRNLQLIKSDNIKFMGTIIPTKDPKINVEITYKLQDNKCLVDAKLYHESTTFTKFKGEFIFI